MPATTEAGGNQDLQRRVTSSMPWDRALDHILYGNARSENVSICPRCFRQEAVGTIACCKCGVTMNNVLISAEQIRGCRFYHSVASKFGTCSS